VALRWFLLGLLAAAAFACDSLTVPYILCWNESSAVEPCNCTNVTSCFYNLTWGQHGVLYVAVENPMDDADMGVFMDGDFVDNIPAGQTRVVQQEFVAPTEGEDCCLWKNHTVKGVNGTESNGCWTAYVATQLAFAPPVPSPTPSQSPSPTTAPSIVPTPSPTIKPSLSPSLKPTASPKPTSRPNQPVIVRVSPSPPAQPKESPPDMLPAVMLLVVGGAVVVFLLIRKR